MRKTILALFLALTACLAVAAPGGAVDGFDLGDMPPLPPPLLDDSSPLPPPPGGSLSPLLQTGPGEDAPSSSPLAPPPSVAGTGGYSAPAGSYGAPAGDTPLPPPPPLAPPPVEVDTAPTQTTVSSVAPSLTPPPPPAGSASESAVTGLADNEIPRSGQITGGRVNVRAGPNTQYESIAVLNTGTPLTVLAQNGEWYKIVYPAEHLASIHKKFVTADIPGEIPEEGVSGVVNQDNADVHAFYWDKSTIVGKLNRGDPVVIRQERGQWYRIVPPANARAYVFAKYVNLDSNGPVVADTAPLPVNASVDITATGPDGKPAIKPKATPEEEKLRELKEARAKELEGHMARLREQEEILRKQEEERLARLEMQQKQAEELVKLRAKADLEARMLQANQLEAALNSLESRLGAIEGEKIRRADVMGRRFGQLINPTTVVGAAAWAPPDPAGGGFVGWVENIGRVGGAPSPYRLTKGGEIRFWLVSDNYDLDQFTNLRVLCDGEIEHAGGTTASILKVNQIRVLTEWEIAGGFPRGVPAPQRQTPQPGQQPGAQPGVPQPQQQRPEQPYVDPYANAVDVTDYNQPGFEHAVPPQPAATGNPFGDPYNPAGYPQPQQPYAPAPGTADIVTSAGTVYAPTATYVPQPGVYQAPAPAPQFPNAQPASGPIRPSDSTQLPDVVGGMASYSTSAGLVAGEGIGLQMGEVETDLYEKPVINEIIP